MNMQRRNLQDGRKKRRKEGRKEERKGMKEGRMSKMEG
jgi:hypothetical protein